MPKLTDKGLDLRDMMLEAQADVQEIIREVLQDFAMPQMVEKFQMTWAQMPPAMKEKFQRERPEEYKALMELM